MAQATDPCKLCLEKQATKKNSHIISKFLVESMLGVEGPRVGYLIDPNSKRGIGRKVQDSPKQDFILCPICEERIGMIERYASNYFHRQIRTENGTIAQPLIMPTHADAIPYVMVPELDDNKFRLFLYSLLWRASISDANCFRTLKLKKKDEEKLRDLLFNLLPVTRVAQEAGIVVNQAKHLPCLPFVLTTPERITSATQNLLGAFNLYDCDAMLFINEYVVIVYLNWDPSSNGAAQYNLPGSPLALGVVSEAFWEEQNKSVAKMLAKLHRRKG